MKLNTDFLDRCIRTLEAALDQLQTVEADDIAYDIFRAACVKEFEIILEQCGNLLKKCLRPYFLEQCGNLLKKCLRWHYFTSNEQADMLNFKDVFRHAAHHNLISVETCERWLQYRDSRNETAHLYGEAFAETTLELLPKFTDDAKELAGIIAEHFDG